MGKLIFIIIAVLAVKKIVKSLRAPTVPLSFRYEQRESDEDSRTYIDQRGYERFSDSDKLVHRWVIEKKIGRRLYPREVIHHINGDKLDNRSVNLWLCCNQKEHERIHGENMRYKLFRMMKNFKEYNESL